MSDFDSVLERLLTDPGFAAALAADPATALGGYQLSPDELELLYAQVSTDPGGERQVEQRTSKASLFGLLSPLAGAIGLTHDSGVGHAVSSAASAHAGLGAADGMGGSGGTAGFGPADVHQGFGAAPGASQGFGPAGQSGAIQGFGPADQSTTQGFGPAGQGGQLGIGESVNVLYGGGPSGPSGVDGIVDDDDVPAGGGPLGGGVTELPARSGFGEVPPPDHHPHVDVDGDGRWDQYTVRTRADGGVDVVADMDHDGRIDFVGHDDNRDGIIDRADYDSDHDGRLETHMRDVNGDGWMDSTSVDPR
jgi:hypothetical protein